MKKYMKYACFLRIYISKICKTDPEPNGAWPYVQLNIYIKKNILKGVNEDLMYWPLANHVYSSMKQTDWFNFHGHVTTNLIVNVLFKCYNF